MGVSNYVFFWRVNLHPEKNVKKHPGGLEGVGVGWRYRQETCIFQRGGLVRGMQTWNTPPKPNNTPFGRFFLVIHPEKFSSTKPPETKFFFHFQPWIIRKGVGFLKPPTWRTIEERNPDWLSKGLLLIPWLLGLNLIYLGHNAATSDRVGLWHCESHRRLMSNPQMLMVKRLGFDGEKMCPDEMEWMRSAK